jgi:polyferredoxin
MLIAASLHVSRVKSHKALHQRFLALIMFAIGTSGVAWGWAENQAAYDFFGTGYLYYIAPALLFLFFTALAVVYFRKHQHELSQKNQ